MASMTKASNKATLHSVVNSCLGMFQSSVLWRDFSTDSQPGKFYIPLSFLTGEIMNRLPAIYVFSI